MHIIYLFKVSTIAYNMPRATTESWQCACRVLAMQPCASVYGYFCVFTNRNKRNKNCKSIWALVYLLNLFYIFYVCMTYINSYMFYIVHFSICILNLYYYYLLLVVICICIVYFCINACVCV